MQFSLFISELNHRELDPLPREGGDGRSRQPLTATRAVGAPASEPEPAAGL